MKNNNSEILSGSIFKNLLLFTIPIILTGVFQLFYNAADIIVVGRYAGSDSLAAVGSTSSITHLFINLFIGLSGGTSVCVAQFVGGKEKENQRGFLQFRRLVILSYKPLKCWKKYLGFFVEKS